MSITTIVQKSFRHISRYVHDNGTLTIITGSNARFFDSLITNLLPSINCYEPMAQLFIWDLGFTIEQNKYLEDWSRQNSLQVNIITFPFEKLPEHYEMSYGNYAFKSYCIYNTMIQAKTDYYFWLDAGCGLREPLYPERNIFKLYGFYSPHSSTNIRQLTYPTVLNDFCENLCHYGEKQMLSGGVVGLSIHNSKAIALIAEWYHYTYNKKLLAPDGSNRDNHRQDQSLLSLCYYSRFAQVPLLATRLYHVKIHLNKG